MSDTITLTGLVATTPRHITTADGLAIASFRLASNQRRFDRAENKWVDGDTNWYTVVAYRHLAANLVASISKGQRVIVAGAIRFRDWEGSEGDRGTNIEIVADAIGLDLAQAPIAPRPTILGDSPVSVAPEPARGLHLSDCAVHNEPAMPAGPCDCRDREANPVSVAEPTA